MTVVGMGRRTIGALVPESFRNIGAILGLKIDILADPVSFSFHRQRRDTVWGWATYLHIGRLTIGAPWVDGLPFPRRRAEAERWVAAFCGRIGIEPMLNVGRCGNPERSPTARAETMARRRRSAFCVVPGGSAP